MDYDELEDHLSDGEEDPEKLKKMKRIHRKVENLMEEAAEVFLTPEILAKIEKKVLTTLEKQGIDPTLSNLKAYCAGYAFGMSSHSMLGNDAVSIQVGMKHMISTRQKGQIDITKSKILPADDASHG